MSKETSSDDVGVVSTKKDIVQKFCSLSIPTHMYIIKIALVSELTVFETPALVKINDRYNNKNSGNTSKGN